MSSWLLIEIPCIVGSFLNQLVSLCSQISQNRSEGDIVLDECLVLRKHYKRKRNEDNGLFH